ncbi:rrna biogenesis protein rrp5 [Pyrenophora tritici-repentis]|nr:rrna biogenesis protein rrp5 [Pyrenophora tritici-repentis]KAF7449479.1 rrna biogenesis protein rrp5 [Pyrenophora tritici-repentis]KAG9383579.1 rrna biogenesis protein rrp5 [Pyrenophora tritici-repentis]KAI1524739.1 rRNA biogenesis protein RRP5 [Pyrenophora tritici-repentis]KAI1525114.1 rRNA biogenesis protein RRP5 [Pyrenophora tritici-repentis]
MVGISGRIYEAENLAYESARCGICYENVNCSSRQENIDGWRFRQCVAFGDVARLGVVGGELDDASVGVDSRDQAHEDGALLNLGMLYLRSQLSLGQEALEIGVSQAQVHD